jgi:fibronectin type 3 domain-containing protein
LALPSIGNVTLSQVNSGVKISWSLKDFSEYFLIYRATEEIGKYQKIAEVDYQKDSFTDTKVKAGKTYYYKFQLRSNHNIQDVKIYSSYTKPVCIKVE